ncbi:MAG: hypothetical protein ACAH89_13345 [Rariglobus sp.]
MNTDDAARRLPLVLWDVNFNADTIGLPPQPATKAERERRAAGGVWAQFPLRTYHELSWITRTRTATVAGSALGLDDQPLVLGYGTEVSDPQYGPQVIFTLPQEVCSVAGRYRLTFDVSKRNLSQSGCVTLVDVGVITFSEEGQMAVNRREIARYEPNTPMRVEVVIDVGAKTATWGVAGKTEPLLTLPWSRPQAQSFRMLRLDGLIPGGFARGASQTAFDNIKLTLEQTL